MQNLSAAGAFRGCMYELPLSLSRIGPNYANDCPRNFDPFRKTDVREIINEPTRPRKRTAAFNPMAQENVDLNMCFTKRHGYVLNFKILLNILFKNLNFKFIKTFPIF